MKYGSSNSFSSSACCEGVHKDIDKESISMFTGGVGTGCSSEYVTGLTAVFAVGLFNLVFVQRSELSDICLAEVTVADMILPNHWHRRSHGSHLSPGSVTRAGGPSTHEAPQHDPAHQSSSQSRDNRPPSLI